MPGGGVTSWWQLAAFIKLVGFISRDVLKLEVLFLEVDLVIFGM